MCNVEKTGQIRKQANTAEYRNQRLESDMFKSTNSDKNLNPTSIIRNLIHIRNQYVENIYYFDHSFSDI